jgi:hypothetical protein
MTPFEFLEAMICLNKGREHRRTELLSMLHDAMELGEIDTKQFDALVALRNEVLPNPNVQIRVKGEHF